MTREHIAVVLLNLGGPDSPRAIYPFLVNFFSDPAIIRAPAPIRFFLARYIALKRAWGPARGSYGMLGGRSPLLENTDAQARALELLLNERSSGARYSVHVAMRYWHPRADALAVSLCADRPDQVILLPLYPQFSGTTSGSSYTDWRRAAAKVGLEVPTRFICCYPKDPGFIAASARNIRAAYDGVLRAHPEGSPPRVLFSAHGLPKKIIQSGDPYQAQCEETAQAIAQALNIPNLDWQICYQSRVGPLEWIGPSTDQAIRKAGQDGVPVVIYPHAFVSEHVETLVEIEHEYRALAATCGVPHFARVQTVMTAPLFIEGLARMVQDATDAPIASGEQGRCCAGVQTQCPCRAPKGF